MIIRYANGKTIEGVTLSRTDDTLRVALKGHNDVVTLVRVNGRWVSEDCEPVEIDLTPRKPQSSIAEADYICSPELASRLIHLLHQDSNDDERESGWLIQRALDETVSCRLA